MIPTMTEAEGRVMGIIARGSVNLGAGTGTERLMLMLTRSCHLRCPYCFVDKREGDTVMSLALAKRAVDLLMTSQRPRLELQLFGGEPTREWPTALGAIRHALDHPRRDGRPLDIVLTTNGIQLRTDVLADLPVTVLLSVDGGPEVARRQRPVHGEAWGEDDAATWARIDAAMDRLNAAGVRWFMNAVVPPTAAEEVPARYAWAKARGVPALQLNYACGMRWPGERSDAYLRGLSEVLHQHHADPGELVLYNWRSDAEPVMLSDDLIVDVDGTVLHDGAIFLERAFPRLREAYRRGHVDDIDAFDPLRWSLATLYDVMVRAYPEGSPERRVIVQNIRLGAAVDLLIGRVASSLGRPASRGFA